MVNEDSQYLFHGFALECQQQGLYFPGKKLEDPSLEKLNCHKGKLYRNWYMEVPVNNVVCHSCPLPQHTWLPFSFYMPYSYMQTKELESSGFEESFQQEIEQAKEKDQCLE